MIERILYSSNSFHNTHVAKYKKKNVEKGQAGKDRRGKTKLVKRRGKRRKRTKNKKTIKCPV
jgi:hypothetical protein